MPSVFRSVISAWTRGVARRLAIFAIALSLLAIPSGSGTSTAGDSGSGSGHNGVPYSGAEA
jgi:hypothetical protein